MSNGVRGERIECKAVRWLSGRRRLTRNQVYLQGYREFKSHPHRFGSNIDKEPTTANGNVSSPLDSVRPRAGPPNTAEAGGGRKISPSPLWIQEIKMLRFLFGAFLFFRPVLLLQVGAEQLVPLPLQFFDLGGRIVRNFFAGAEFHDHGGGVRWQAQQGDRS